MVHHGRRRRGSSQTYWDWVVECDRGKDSAPHHAAQFPHPGTLMIKKQQGDIVRFGNKSGYWDSSRDTEQGSIKIHQGAPLRDLFMNVK